MTVDTCPTCRRPLWPAADGPDPDGIALYVCPADGFELPRLVGNDRTANPSSPTPDVPPVPLEPLEELEQTTLGV